MANARVRMKVGCVSKVKRMAKVQLKKTEGVALTVQARKDGLCKICLPKSLAPLRSSLYQTFLVTNFQVISGNMRGFGSVVCQRAPFRAVDLSFEAW